MTPSSPPPPPPPPPPSPSSPPRPSPTASAAQGLQRLTRRSLLEAELAGPELCVYKHDGRSRVWLTTDANGSSRVIKRFEHSLFRQKITRLVGRHPAQLELKGQRLALARQLPAILSVDGGIDAQGRVWLATAHTGPSLQDKLPEQAQTYLPHLRELFVAIHQAGLTFKDLKASNVVLDSNEQPWLIDIGCIKKRTNKEQTQRMKSVLRRTLKRDQVPDDIVDPWVDALPD